MYFGQMHVLTKQRQRCFGRALQGLVNFIIFRRIFMFQVYVTENAKESVNKFSKMISVLTNRECVGMLICFPCIMVPQEIYLPGDMWIFIQIQKQILSVTSLTKTSFSCCIFTLLIILPLMCCLSELMLLMLFSIGFNTLYNICHEKISLQSFYLRIFCFGEFHRCQKFCCCKSRQSNAQSHIVQIILELSQLCEFGLKIAVQSYIQQPLKGSTLTD